MSDDTEEIRATATRLVELLQQFDGVAVAFSGGVDSAVVAMAAHQALRERAVAVTAVSPSLASIEFRTAQDVARQIGIRLVTLTTGEFQRPEYRANQGDRCFYCKDTLYALAEQKLADLGVSGLVNGANTDDLGDHRPGMQAATQHGVRSPLIECGINKATVRQLAHYWNLSVADKPASPCLSSRIAYGVEVTEARVRMVETAEAVVRRLAGLQEFRVRLEAGELARIEVPLPDLSRLLTSDVREPLAAELRSLGFRAVTLDLEGFRSGNLNQALVPLRLSADFSQPPVVHGQ
ncbi:MAG: ATP-dependent sacrificial sulfur transferase LarE [Planctomycetaceae bacterium]|nr:ATP-dependent sacrificial sulfur transferase LarE [Planctomycetaceae bacterium]